MPADPRRVKELFVAALDLPDPPARQALLDRECAGDADLRRRLDVLLAAHDRPDAALDEPFAPKGAVTIDEPAPADMVGTIVAGRYKLLEAIGEGGMGTVWMAEQREPVKRLVALKLIKPGMDSRAVLARFEAERQALALMDHPNIAKVLDGGTTAEGRPYFVMELVKGLPLTEYCDDRRLSVRERLELFVPVCRAVQHAHQKGVIHRDLKPSNILVTEHDGRPVPKVIDFGLAKALNAASVLTDRTLHTAYGTVVGTPLYMAPEQVGINALDVDTRCDVYALGVILYELLTGTTPLEKRRLKEAAWDEIRRVIREEEPPRPSLRLSTSDALPSLAAQRQTEPAKLSRLVRGDLDWIVLKALEKDRNRRYETANGLARDVQRHLADEPVLACPPSAGYRLGKFARKHRAGLATAAALAALLVLGVVVSAWQAVRALRAREDARAAAAEAIHERDRARAAEAQSKAEAENARAVLDFIRNDVVELLGGMRFDDKSWQKLRRQVLPAAERLAGRFDSQPETEVRVRILVGMGYFFDEDYPAAQTQIERAYELLRRLHGDEHAETLQLLDWLANVQCEQKRYAQAEALYFRELTVLVRDRGENDNDLGVALSGLFELYRRWKEPERALAGYKWLIEQYRARYAGRPREFAAALVALGERLFWDQSYAAAELPLRESLAVYGQNPTDDGRADYAQVLLGKCLACQKKYAEAEPLLLQAYQRLKRRADALTGPRRGWLLTGASWLVELYRDWDNPAEAARWRAEQDNLLWAIADAPPAVK